MRVYVGIVFFSILVFGWSATAAAIPTSLSYQAYLTEADGTAINGNTGITFSIYNVEFGGVPLWSGTQLVVPDQGLFSVELGDPGNPLPPGLFSTPLFIGIDVAGDGEMLPRRRLTSVGFAFEADNALSLQGQGPAVFDQTAHVADTGNPHAVTAAQTDAASTADIADLQSQLDVALANITALQTTIATLQTDVSTNTSSIATETTDRIADVDAEEAARVTADTIHSDAISTIQANTVLALDGILTHPDNETALFTGVNVQVVNGTGTTDGEPNGTGNVIVGYNAVDVFGGAVGDTPICGIGRFISQFDCEDNNAVWAQSHKSGSHNIVVGDEHNYSRFGGLVAGKDNNINGVSASVTGGALNTASGEGSSISGGEDSTASGISASVSGGSGHLASGVFASVSGGGFNQAIGNYASANGGGFNQASSDYASVSGGQNNHASGDFASVTGGSGNLASGDQASVSGGVFNHASAIHTSVSGGSSNIASGDLASVSGGGSNTASGVRASVSGGIANHASNLNASVSGGSGNIASGFRASVSGGEGNTAAADVSSISGGKDNDIAIGATGSAITGGLNGLIDSGAINASIAGGFDNTVLANYAHISGGRANTALGPQSAILGGNSNTTGTLVKPQAWSVVVGGQFNAAEGAYSVVSGGSSRTAANSHDWVAGVLLQDD